LEDHVSEYDPVFKTASSDLFSSGNIGPDGKGTDVDFRFVFGAPDGVALRLVLEGGADYCLFPFTKAGECWSWVDSELNRTLAKREVV
jgi:hypothetical protein